MKGGKREIAPEYNNKVRWSIYWKAVKRFSHLSMMLEIESKRCNPSIQQKSYGDVKAIAFSVCAGHGTNSVGDKLTTGSYRQV